MRLKTFVYILSIISINSPGFAGNLSTSPSKKIADPSVYFLSAGSAVNGGWRYRVALSTVAIESVIVVEKVTPEGEYEGEGNYEKDYKAKVAWSRIVNLPFNVSPREFAQSFKWLSPSSFSFTVENANYIIDKIDNKAPQLKKMDR